jgi:DNA-binding MarR family transcriptional regulator
MHRKFIVTCAQIMPTQETIDFNLRWGWAKLARLYSAEAERRGITLSVGYALLSIEREGTPSTKLGPRMGMEPTSLSRTLKGMEDKGLIERRPDPNDGRSVRVFLTPLGVDSRRQARDLVVGINKRLATMLGSETLKELNEGLQRLNSILEDPEHLMPLKNEHTY